MLALRDCVDTPQIQNHGKIHCLYQALLHSQLELSVGWIDPRVGLGWEWVRNFSFQWVGLGLT